MRHLLLVSLLALLTTGCASAPSGAPSPDLAAIAPASVQVGDFWEYRVRDVYTGFDRGRVRYEVVQADADRMTVEILRDGQPSVPALYTQGWGGIEHTLTNLPRFRFQPPFPAYGYPLAPGRRWYAVVNAMNPVTRETYRVHTRGRVVGWERIRVPAGEFDALRIERDVFAGNSTAVRSQEEIHETEWYVPALGRPVRMRAFSQHFDSSRGGGDGGGEYPLRIGGDWLVSELVSHSR